MGFMDKVKAQATQVAQKAQDAGRAGQAKVESAQAQRQASGQLRELGRLVYAQRTGRGTADTDAQIEACLASLRSHETDQGADLTVPTPPEPSSAPGAVPEGDFRLDES
ncbi:MAG TPA: hypothetical protein VNN74_10075 [Candidatus Micrarchaeia archaeon]|nr:hypothetical protein [Candidatus Micrarchaeia archaeon]